MTHCSIKHFELILLSVLWFVEFSALFWGKWQNFKWPYFNQYSYQNCTKFSVVVYCVDIE